MQIAIFGLGKMGSQIAKRLQDKKFEVLAWNRSEGPREEVAKAGIKTFADVGQLVKQLDGQNRIFWLMLPQEIVHDFIFGKEGLMFYLKEGDIVIDGGNSFYKESVKLATLLKAHNIHFFDCGTSGGVWGEKNGFALMVGGPKELWPTVEPVFKALSSGQNYGLVGENGAGHFVKMVHNGIEYGMMESIAEGYAILQASHFKPDLKLVTKIYQEGSVVRGWLIDLMAKIFENEDVDATSGVVAATGEGEWTVNAGKELGVDARVIEDALKVRQESSDPTNQNKFSNKIVALLRKQFGGHEVSKK
jgi:6-phosphogluconate dehydrogenase